MKLVTYERNGRQQPGVLSKNDSLIIDLAAEAHRFRGEIPSFLTSVQAIVEEGARALDELHILRDRAACDAISLDDVTLLAPLPRPVQVRDFLCFEKHLIQGFNHARSLRASKAADPVREMERMEREGILRVPDAWYELPLYYRANPANVCGNNVEVTWPYYSSFMDFEFEFACVIGRSGKNISVEDAPSHIFGFMIFNDLSARDEQVRVMPGQLGPGKGKDFDNSMPMGPYLVTADEISDPYNLTMSARLNGDIFVEGSTSEMNWRFEDCIAYASQAETLHPGEIFCSGTVGGGCALEVGRTLAVGDTIELEIEGLGVLRTRFACDPHSDARERLKLSPRNVERQMDQCLMEEYLP